jgi:hypothetical protein
MFDRSVKVRSVVGIAAAVMSFAIVPPLAAADPAPRFIPHTQQAPRHLGEGLSGADRSWLSLKQTTPRLGEGLTGADRSWLAHESSERHAASPTNPFDWGDAGIGAGSAAVVLLVAGGSVLAIRRRLSPAH